VADALPGVRRGRVRDSALLWTTASTAGTGLLLSLAATVIPAALQRRIAISTLLAEK
jgi:hypothetical protein